MVKVNLLGKRKVSTKGKSYFVITSLVIFIGFTLYFVANTAYVLVRIAQIKYRQGQVDAETVSVSKELTANDKSLRDFILSKFILGQVNMLNQTKFPYKVYLDQLVSLLPEGVVLKNVDFANKGWIAVVATMSNMNTLRLFENSMSDPEKLKATAFDSVFLESVSKDKAGLYMAKLQLQLRKNGGK